MSDTSEILKLTRKIHEKVSSLSNNKGATSSKGGTNSLGEYFIKDSDAGAILYKRSSYEENIEPEVFSKKDIAPFEEDFGFSKVEILKLHNENNELIENQRSYNYEKNKMKEEQDKELNNKEEINKDLTLKVGQLSSANQLMDIIISENLNIDFIQVLDDKSMFLELAIMLKSLDDKDLPDLYRDNISANDKKLSTLFHISYLICTLYNNKDQYQFDLGNINAIIQHVNIKIDGYQIEEYSNNPEQVFDAAKHETDDNSPFKILKFITLPIYLKDRLDEEPVRKALVKTDN